MTVHSLHGATPAGEADESIVAFVRDLLAEAERGEVVGVGIVKIRPNREIGTAYLGQPGMGHNHLIVAGCHYLAHDVAAEP